MNERRKRRPYGMALPAKERIRKGGGAMPAVCIDCGEGINVDAVAIAIRGVTVYRHSCGRVLFDPRRHR